jgi:UPF0176 protein
LRKLKFQKQGTDSKGNIDYVILLYYKYVLLEPDEVDEVMKFHEDAEHTYDLTGRVRVGKEGINGTVGGSPHNIAAYRKAYDESVAKLKGTEFKVSRVKLPTKPFPMYHLKKVSEIIRLGVDAPVEGRAAHLSPQEFHKLAQQSEEYTILDVRNYYESEVGHFPNAVRTCTRTFDELPQWVEANMDSLKKKPLLMYCTGGIRCERASSFLKAQGLAVKGQLQGGIHEYLEWSDAPLFKGRNFVFDRRIVTERVGDDILGECANCKCKHDTFDRGNRCYICSSLVLVCQGCAKRLTLKQKKERLDMRCVYCIANKVTNAHE